MPARKMRIELFDSEGNRYTIAFEGQVTREKALRLLDLVELLGGMPSGGNPGINTASNELSKYDKVHMIIQRHFPINPIEIKPPRSFQCYYHSRELIMHPRRTAMYFHQIHRFLQVLVDFQRCEISVKPFYIKNASGYSR